MAPPTLTYQRALELPVEELKRLIAEGEKTLKAVYEVCPYLTYVPNPSQYRWLAMLQKGIDEGKMKFGVFDGNSSGKTLFLAQLIWAIMCPPESRSPWFNVPFITNWKWGKHLRLVCKGDDLKDVSGMIWQLVDKWWPKTEYTTAKQDRPFISLYTHKTTKFYMDVRTFDQPVEAHDDGSTIAALFVNEPPPVQVWNAYPPRLREGGFMLCTATLVRESRFFKEDVMDNPNAAYSMGDIEGNCFPINTQILTKDGWDTIENMRKQRLVATLNIDNQQLEYQPVKSIIHRKHDGPMICYSDMHPICTPDHRMFVGNTGGGLTVEQMPWGFRKAFTLTRGHRMLPFIPAGYEPSHIKVESPFPDKITGRDWCEFMGWYISEGSCFGTKTGKVTCYEVHISQAEGKKKDRIRELLLRTPWKWKEVNRGSRSMFRVCAKQLHQLLFPLGTSSQKRIPRYMFDYPDEWLRILWQTLLDGDGDGVKRYVTVSEGLADDVQELLIRLGYRTSIRRWFCSRRANPKGYNLKDQFCVTACQSRYVHIGEVDSVPFSGEVGCVTVDNSTIIVRDPIEKSPIIVGNCYEHSTLETTNALTGKPIILRGTLHHENLEAIIKNSPAHEQEARRTGRPVHLSGAALPVAPATHFVGRSSLPSLADATSILTLDPHERRPWAMMVLLKDGFDKFHVVDEWPKITTPPWNSPYHKIANANVGYEVYVNAIRQLKARWRIKDINCVIDSKFAAKTLTGDHTAQKLRELLQTKFKLRFVSGATAVRGENGGINTLTSALNFDSSKPVAFGNQPHFFVADDLWNTKYQLENITWDEMADAGRYGESETLDEKFLDFPRLAMYGIMHKSSRGLRPEPSTDAEANTELETAIIQKAWEKVSAEFPPIESPLPEPDFESVALYV